MTDIPEPVQSALETVQQWMGESGYGAAVISPQGDFTFKTRQELAEAQSWTEARRNTQMCLVDVIRAAEIVQAALVEHRRIWGHIIDMDVHIASSELIYAASNNFGRLMERVHSMRILTEPPKR